MTRIRLFALFLSCVLLCAVSLSAQTPATPASTLTVHITGLRNATGKIRLTLFRDSQRLESRVLDIDANTLTAKTVFEKLPRGTYAVYLFQDENMNGQMDFDSMGVPLEGYGASNNPAQEPGRPGFEKTNFSLDKPEHSIEIKLVYWQ